MLGLLIVRHLILKPRANEVPYVSEPEVEKPGFTGAASRS